MGVKVEIATMKNRGRRRFDRRLIWVGMVSFVAMFLFVFLVGISREKEEDASAASLASFDPGFIISDWQMGNYQSMNEAEIQAFLTAKNACGNRDYDYYLRLSTGSKYKWHFENGHFVCLSEERFGDGEVIGTGETAAHIIWQAAQDYRINPQVLIVLLEKETSLITDPIPNDGDYRKATGYGCPDTAACSSKYYGFKNQVRNAAAMFRTVLNGGWTNYPLGNNYVQYNPNKDCGGSVVNIRSLATSALYRYTPYQPNAGALAAGYGTASCGAYGNRNFYLYFTDWFGDPKAEAFNSMVVPRILSTKNGATYYSIKTGERVTDVSGQYLYAEMRAYIGGALCLASREEAANGLCVFYSEMNDYPTVKASAMDVPRVFLVRAGVIARRLADGASMGASGQSRLVYMTKKLSLNNKLHLVDEEGNYYAYSDLQEVYAAVGKMEAMTVGRALKVKSGAKAINVADATLSKVSISDLGLVEFSTKTYIGDKLCLGTADLIRGSKKWCISYDDLEELPEIGVGPMVIARDFYIPSGVTYYDVATGLSKKDTKGARVVHFSGRAEFMGRLCLVTSNDYRVGAKNCYFYDDLKEINAFSDMMIARSLDIKSRAKVVSTVAGLSLNETVGVSEGFFTKRVDINGELCLATDTLAKEHKCILYTDLIEK